MNAILSFGEILIRQQSLGDSFFESPKNQLEIFPGGSEANVAASLGQMGNTTYYCSAFPKNALSEEILAILNKLDVDTSKVIQTGDRIGSYLLLSANGLTKGEVIYDRKYSSFSLLTAEDIDMNKLFEGVTWLHWTALTPALNQNIADIMASILKEASNRNIYISVDLNYRSKLWQYGKKPIEIMPELINYCDVIMGNIWAANVMLGISVDPDFDRNTSQEVYIEASKKSAKSIFAAYPKCKHVANTFRFMDHPTHNLFYATYHTPEEDVCSQTHETQEVVDRIGSGDAFMAGLIHALVNNFSPAKIIETATNAGFQKLFIKGDFGDGQYN
ncbi:sugar kinase [Sphingobacterium sp. UT-1RO-CII-1]|uniref:sugar kinase n=1 Tax=Sphingobacterium sp. UT-1RO-CII-1 TaxID=2995225 RepID=UPI00227C1D0C|nr:sugar kinase [Sphingobacterium sp. UT-1RO-CII-1]MCY4778039.1 sugar kinase [Sphingobacterium sp. UT-1RO-CII-1]